MTRRDAWERKALRRAAEPVPARKPPAARPARYLVAHACFRCRRSFKQPCIAGRTARCTGCGGELHAMGRAFRAPPARNVAQWKKVEQLYRNGFRFPSSTTRAAPALPRRLADVAAFIAEHPDHPFRARPRPLDGRSG